MKPKKTEQHPEAPEKPTLLEEIAESHKLQPSPARDLMLVGACVNAEHPTLVGRALVRWTDESGAAHEQWLPTLQGLTIREHDRVLVQRPSNWAEPIVTGVVDGFARRPEAAKLAGATVTLKPDEAVRVVTTDGQPLLELSQSEAGTVVKLMKPDVSLELPGRLCVRADSIELAATQGPVTITATDDVIIKGEMVNLN